MYMGVILELTSIFLSSYCAPHVYGGDPILNLQNNGALACSPCIWG